MVVSGKFTTPVSLQDTSIPTICGTWLVYLWETMLYILWVALLHFTSWNTLRVTWMDEGLTFPLHFPKYVPKLILSWPLHIPNNPLHTTNMCITGP